MTQKDRQRDMERETNRGTKRQGSVGGGTKIERDSTPPLLAQLRASTNSPPYSPGRKAQQKFLHITIQLTNLSRLDNGRCWQIWSFSDKSSAFL